MTIILWVTVAGALVGLATGGGGGLIAGLLGGAAMGQWLQTIIRAEIAARLAKTTDAAPYSLPYQPAPAERREATATRASDAAATASVAATPPPPPPPRSAAPEPPRVIMAETRAPAFDNQPSPFVQMVERARSWLLGGNTIVRAGLVVLFLGLVFLARLVAHAGLFPIEARLATIAGAGLALLGVGLRKRQARPEFALSLQGAGVAVLYLVVFAAAKAFGVMPPLAAFACMVLFAVLGCTLAVLQDSRAMALASFLGGFAVPVLIGGHADTPLGLFTYLTVLNVAIMAVAWRKSWRALNLLGFVATFALASAWGFTAYQERNYLICQLFLIGSIAIYLATAVLYAHNTPGPLGNFADSTLLFGTAIVGFGLQIGLVHHQPFASAWSALGFAAAYIVLCSITMRRQQAEMRLLNECLLAIGVGFVTLAVPLALDVHWTAAAWALEGAGAIWVGARQARWMPRAMGLTLQLLSAIMVIVGADHNVAALPFANNGFLLPLLVAAPVLFAAWLQRTPLPDSDSPWAQAYRPAERGLAAPWFLIGFVLACIAITQEATRALPTALKDGYPVPVLGSAARTYAQVLGILAAMLVADGFGAARDWAVARWPARLALPLAAVALLHVLVNGRHVLAWPDLAAWVAIIATELWLLRRQPPSRWTYALHVGRVLMATLVLADTVWLGIDRGQLWHTSWAGVSFLASATAMLAVLIGWAGRATAQARWPLATYGRAYWWHGALVLAVLVYGGGLISALWAEGIADPLPYLPLLNPVDLGALLALVVLAAWRRMLGAAADRSWLADLLAGRAGLAMLGLFAFVVANTIWLRAAHHLFGVGWNSGDLAASAVVQAGLSLLWTLIAMALMLRARASGERALWLAGAVLLGAVVVKLVLVEMSKVEGAARIVAFVGVGLLMVLIGYFVPLPPPRAHAAGDDA